MEKPRNNQPELAVETVVPQSELNDGISGVFERADAVLKLSLHEAPKKSVKKILGSFDLPNEDTENLASETMAKLQQLDNEELALHKEAERSLLTKIRDWANKNKFATTLLLAGAVHSPIIARSSGFLEKVQNMLNTVRAWEMPNTIVDPQSFSEKEQVVKEIYERGSRIDKQKKEVFEKEQREKLERGEDVSFNDTFLKLEELNGVDSEKVKIAEQKKQEMIEKFAARMGNDFSEDFIKSVVNEMFGSNKNYEWGQGSVTEYFNTGKRNCVSIARAEQMVFEALIDRLPAEKRSKYQLGTAFEKQHEIAILKVINQDGSIDRTYFLQPPIPILEGAADRPGSPTVDLKTMQHAMVSSKPMSMSSNAKPGEIADSPDIIAITNQPVSTNINIEGKLKASDYIEQIVEDRGIEIKSKEPSATDKVMDLEIIHNDDVEKSQQKIEDAYKYIEAHLPSCLDQENCKDPDMIDRSVPFVGIDLSTIDWKNLEPKQVDEIFSGLFKLRALPDPDTINFGDINHLSSETIERIAKLRAPEITLELKNDKDGNLSMENIYQLIDIYRKKEKEGYDISIDMPRVHILLGEDVYNAALIELLDSLPGGQFIIDQKNAKTRSYVSTDTAEAIVHSKAKDLYLEGADLTAEGLEMIIKNPNKTYHFGLSAYIEIIRKRPDVVNVPHIKPWVDKLFMGAEIDNFRTTTDPNVWRKIQPIVEKLEEDAIQKYYQGFYGDDVILYNK